MANKSIDASTSRSTSLDPLRCTIQPDGNGRVTGWVSEPDFRGTWDIVWTCFVTVFICSFTVLCLNVPAKDDTPFVLFRRRLFWMLLAILAPEIVLTYAAGQWSRAQHSVNDFHQAGYKQWTMRMAFFADMGGFVLETRDCEPFPLNAKQLHWLVVNERVDYPDARAEEIWDKSKQDRFARLITAFQVSYTILQAIGRAVQHLTITILELNTLGIVVCSLMTAFAWLHKPADVRTPVRITPKMGKTTIIHEITGNNGLAWRTTPLDFVDANGPGWAMNVQPFMKMPVISPERPIRRIPNDRFPMDPYGFQEYCLCFATLLFTAVHVAGWNFSFPTELERILWRVSSLVLFSVTAAFWMLETVASWMRLGRWRRLYLWLTDRSALLDLDDKAQQQDPETAEKKRNPMELPTGLGVLDHLACCAALRAGQAVHDCRGVLGATGCGCDGVCHGEVVVIFPTSLTWSVGLLRSCYSILSNTR
ncbi:hypothetical protein B0H66DRAFT_588703 [Apodospora peruviana]|uniref:Uncharacterized protein n=1 Tax=Apodospora peruviana TaxID=516989 RepID=A0AAE0IJF4_9PEZI|nr:hypothetical protein B0H66DRAFT_588703 [Apodospora peruviana]